MGVFNSVYFECPHCGATSEEQYKPGSMNGWQFPLDADRMPIDYLGDFQDRVWHCYKCKQEFHTDVSIEIKITGAVVNKAKP